MQLKLGIKFEPQNVLPCDGEAIYYPQFFDSDQSNYYFDTLLRFANWKQEPFVIYEKEIMYPRLIAWYPNLDKYSKSTNEVMNILLQIKTQVENISGKSFDSALINQYRNGKDGVAWHRDKELGKYPLIASVSFGATRSFQLKHYQDQDLKAKLNLAHGDFLLMKESMQHYWLHSIRKTAKPVGIRINITFRCMNNIQT